jgi:acid phosphatase
MCAVKVKTTISHKRTWRVMRLRSRIGMAITVAAAVAAAAATLTTVSTHSDAASKTSAPTHSSHAKLTATAIPKYSHVVIVMEENHSYSDIIGNTSQAPYFNTLAGEGALMTSSYAVTHPSEPNYMALFSGSTDGLSADDCPVTSSAANLGSELLTAGYTFKGYSEGLPSTGSTACTSGEYARKHSPWINFTNVPASDSLPFSSFPGSSDYSSLPTLSFVIPNLDDDMHDGTIQEADTWLNHNLSAYATWAQSNNSLLVVTWDEDDYTENNQVPTIFVGAGITPGDYSGTINHYNVLATLEQMYGLSEVGSSSGATPITAIFSS